MVKKLDVNDCGYDRRTLLLLRSLSLAVYNNDFILGIASVEKITVCSEYVFVVC